LTKSIETPPPQDQVDASDFHIGPYSPTTTISASLSIVGSPTERYAHDAHMGHTSITQVAIIWWIALACIVIAVM